MSMVLVVEHERRPCASVQPGRARYLLSAQRAAVWRRYPFTLILKEGETPDEATPLRLKIDPGSKTTGLAVVNDTTGQVVWAAELTHRGQQVKARLDQRLCVGAAAATATPATVPHGSSIVDGATGGYRPLWRAGSQMC